MSPIQIDIPQHKHGKYTTHKVTVEHVTMTTAQKETHKALAQEDVSRAIFNILNS